jgi:hypothetical protein
MAIAETERGAPGAIGRSPPQTGRPAQATTTSDKTNRRRGRRTPKLAEDVIVSRFWANRHGDAVVVQLRDYEGHTLVDVRKHFTSADGKLLPTKKGLAIAVLRLPDLANAINQAVNKARELSLLPANGEADHA